MKENQFLLFLKATGQTYLRCAAKATQGLRRNWTLIIAALAAYLLVILASKLLAPWGFAGGIMLGLISIMLLSMYFGWIVETVQGRRLSWQDFVRFEMGLFSDTLSVAFLLFIITWPFQISQSISNNLWLLLCVKLGLVVIFNAIPEVVHQRRLDGISALLAAAKFIRDNWIEWFFPLAVLAAPLLLLFPIDFLMVLASSEPLLPVLIIIKSWQPLEAAAHQAGTLIALAGLVLGHWFMLFRAHLFNELEGGNRRKRIYQAGLQ